MRRYVNSSTALAKFKIKSEDWYEADAVDSLARVVFEPEPTCKPCGILDADGSPIFVIDTIDPIGFVHWDDDDD